MSDEKCCRICLRNELKMYEQNRFQLKFHYEEVTGSKILEKDPLPKWFCYECATLLYKYVEFKKECHSGQQTFKRLLEAGYVIGNITKRSELTNIRSHLQIISVYTNKNIRTFSVKHGGGNEFGYKKHPKKKKNNSFTEVFVDEIKTDLGIEVISNIDYIDKENNTYNVSKSPVFKNTVQNDENGNHSDDSNKLMIDMDHLYNEDFSDSIPLNNENHLENKTEEETNEIQTETKEISNKTTNIEIQINQDKERSKTVKERTRYIKKRKIYEKDRSSPVKGKTSYDKEKTIGDIKNENSSEKTSLDNKFQGSIKKKFLDENHWNKITLTDEEATRRFQAKALEQKYLKADFKCVDCYRTFSQEEMLKRHIILRHCESLGPNECRHCHMRFKWKSRLQKHLMEHYTIYKCLRCELSFPVEISAFQHDYSHNGVTWTCVHCGQGFRHSSTYYTHLRKHKSAHVCSLCGVSFVSEFGLFMHKRVKHVINQDCKEENSNTYCKVCDIKFDNLKGYEEHFTESALHATEVEEGATSLPLKTRCTKKRVPRITTTCTSCSKTFSTYAAFTKHHLSLHPALPLPKSRTDKGDEQKQVCEVCGVTLASAWSLVNHLNTHSRDKRYTCTDCGMQLSSRSVLQRHQQTHAHNKLYICDQCQKQFTHRSGLRLHIRAHNRERARNRKKMTEPQNVLEYFKNYETLANYGR